MFYFSSLFWLWAFFLFFHVRLSQSFPLMLALQCQGQIAVKNRRFFFFFLPLNIFLTNKIWTLTFWTHNHFFFFCSNSPRGKQECLQDFTAMQLVVFGLCHSARQLQTDQVNTGTDHPHSEHCQRGLKCLDLFSSEFPPGRALGEFYFFEPMEANLLWTGRCLWWGLAHLFERGRPVATVCNVA